MSKKSIIIPGSPDNEQQLLVDRESLDFALESGRMGTWDINLEAHTVSCSKEMLDLWGVSPEDFNGERSVLQKKVHPSDFQLMIAAIDFAILNQSIYELEYRIYPKPDEQKWVLSRGRCIYKPGSKKPVRFAGVVFDITDRKEKEEALAQAMKTREEFFKIAGHELKTPLTCLHLQIKALQLELQQQSPKVFELERVKNGFKKQEENLIRITRIIDNILDETRITQGQLVLQYEKFDLVEMVSEVLERFKLLTEMSNVEVKFQSIPNAPGKWDRLRLEQVVMNLLLNAARYGNKKPIEVEVGFEDINYLIHVRDQGIGIQASDHQRIFRIFERAAADTDVRGMGIGLYISHNIMLAHGGSIRLKSELNQGSEFTIVLPK